MTRYLLLGPIAAAMLAALAFVPAGVSTAGTAYAIGSSPSPSPAPVATCGERPVRNDFATDKAYEKALKKYKICLKKNASLFNDEDLYFAGFDAAKAGEYEDALYFLRLAKNQQDPRILTYIGYATRKLGKVDEGIDFYLQALARNPNYVEAREYLGEGYLQKGDLTKAKQQLAEIEIRCGRSCEAYGELTEHIAAYEARSNG